LRNHAREFKGILPPQENPPAEYFDVVVHVKSKDDKPWTRFRIRRDNLYLVEDKTSEHRWYIFRNGDRHLFPDQADTLNFDGSFTSLMTVARRWQISDVRLGKQALRKAALTLSSSPEINTDNKDIAQALILVVIMICEAMRFHLIRDHIAESYDSACKMAEQMVGCLKSWQDLSVAIQNEMDPDKWRTQFGHLGIENVSEATRMAALMWNARGQVSKD